jgi:membrane-associated phospholipid phosphatase
MIMQENVKHNLPEQPPPNPIASAVSNILNPVVFVVLCIIMIGLQVADDVTWQHIAILVGFSLLMPVLFLLWQISKGNITDFFMQHRDQRDWIYVVAFGSNLVAAWLLNHLTAPALIRFSIVVALCQIGVMGLINQFSKISAHASVVTIFCCLVTMLYGSWLWFTFALVPLVGWGRITLQKHSFKQTTAGIVVSAAIFLIVKALFPAVA